MIAHETDAEANMRSLRVRIDRQLGRAYSRVLALFCALVSFGFVVSGIAILWRSGGHLFGWLWLSGGVMFGMIGVASWRSRATLSEVFDRDGV